MNGTGSFWQPLRTVVQRPLWRTGLGLLLFAAGFAFANRFQLTHGVLYRAAANDFASALSNFMHLAIQAAFLVAALVLLSRRMFIFAMVLAAVSILVNLGFGQTTAGTLDTATLGWMLNEARQASNAAGEFTGPLLSAAAQTALAIACFAAARMMIRRGGWVRPVRTWAAAGLVLLLTPSVLGAFADLYPPAAERNVYALGAEIALAEPPPPRAPVEWQPRTQGTVRHVVWLIDESVAHDPFQRVIAPRLEAFQHLDFGIAAALGNCSAPANVALRSGVDVRRAGPAMDLRRTPAIWTYARKAGYRTSLIDGQTSGAPQNLLLGPEKALIDEVQGVAAGIDTDLKIAERLNRRLKGNGRSFTYAILRGVHFQYRDHYPPGAIPPDSPVMLHYETALAYSKGRFFDQLLDGVDRRHVAIVYTSDHGQNLREGALPHCSRDPGAEELRVPLLAFLPDRLTARYGDAAGSGHSASQIFPATLIWMGYDPQAVQRRYDNDLAKPTARYVWFDRNVIPLRTGDPVGVTAGESFP